MKQTNYIREMSWTAFVERKKATSLVIIPSGAYEVYGPHLPLGSDTLVAQKLAEQIAQHVHAMIGPTLEVGDSATLSDFPGTIVIRPEHFKLYLNDVVESLLKWGFTDFLFVNNHAGNVPMISQLCTSLTAKSGIRCAQLDFWRFIQSHDEGILESGKMAHRHAGEAGTSVLSYLYPELVDMDAAQAATPKMQINYPDIMQYFRLADITDTGCVGNPTLGSAEKGRVLVERTVSRVVEFLKNEWKIG